jgi:aspartokinase-like uncharacterized kinase
MSTATARVIKLGGSLLDWPELPGRLRAWLATQSPAANIVVVGGGAFVDYLRQLDRAHQFSPEAAHWLAIGAMSLTAQVVAAWLDEARLVLSLERLQLASAPSCQIFDVARFLREDQSSHDALPCGWHVTSDSIAARVATVLGAAELVLLKSSLPSASTREAWSRTAFVDAYFARASVTLAVRCVNLRAPHFPEILAE